MKTETKDTKKNEVMETKTLHGKTHDEIREILQNLNTQKNQVTSQVNEAQVAVNNGQTMLLKLQGARELVVQMLPEENDNDAKNTDRAS